MYSVRLPKDLKDKEKAYQHQQAADAYTVEDPANLVGALWGKFNKTSTGRNRHQRSIDGNIVLTAVRRSDEDARNRPFIPNPQYLKNTAVVHDIILRHFLVVSSNQCVQLRRDALLNSLKYRFSVQKQEEAHQRELARLEMEAAKKCDAVVKIQAMFKGHIARESCPISPPPTDDDITASGLHRYRHQMELDNHRDWAATKIQSLFRMKRARCIVSSLRRDHADQRRTRIRGIAAKYIQRWWLRWRRRRC